MQRETMDRAPTRLLIGLPDQAVVPPVPAVQGWERPGVESHQLITQW